MKIYFKKTKDYVRASKKQNICLLLEIKPRLDEVAIASALGVDLEEACRLCEELVKEKRIERVLGLKITREILKAKESLKYGKFLNDEEVFGKKEAKHAGRKERSK